VIIGIHLRVSRLLDLQDNTTRTQLGILSDTELVGAWRFMPNPPTQLLGDSVFKDGFFEGIVFPSAQNPGHSCIVVFPGRLSAVSRIDFFDPATGLNAHLP
jgi:hypothetical protein